MSDLIIGYAEHDARRNRIGKVHRPLRKVSTGIRRSRGRAQIACSVRVIHLGLPVFDPDPADLCRSCWRGHIADLTEEPTGLAHVISDPGSVLPREKGEPVVAWIARAVVASGWYERTIAQAQASERDGLAREVEVWTVDAMHRRHWSPAGVAEEILRIIRGEHT